MGMLNDFTTAERGTVGEDDNGPNRIVNGEHCDGYMGYSESPKQWSKCSVTDFERHYISQNWARCMPRAGSYSKFICN